MGIIKFRLRHHGFSTSGCLLTFDYHKYKTIEMSVVENMGVAVGSLFQTVV